MLFFRSMRSLVELLVLLAGARGAQDPTQPRPGPSHATQPNPTYSLDPFHSPWQTNSRGSQWDPFSYRGRDSLDSVGPRSEIKPWSSDNGQPYNDTNDIAYSRTNVSHRYPRATSYGLPVYEKIFRSGMNCDFETTDCVWGLVPNRTNRQVSFF